MGEAGLDTPPLFATMMRQSVPSKLVIDPSCFTCSVCRSLPGLTRDTFRKFDMPSDPLEYLRSAIEEKRRGHEWYRVHTYPPSLVSYKRPKDGKKDSGPYVGDRIEDAVKNKHVS